MTDYYKEDLAFIHDVGFSDFVLKSAPGLLDILARNKIRDGLVVDLGCGSGLWAEQLIFAGYRVLGIDISEEMIRIARRRAPQAEFLVGSLFDIDLPPCGGITSLGECVNYLFDPGSDRRALTELFRRVYGALIPGGVFIFDIAEPGQVREGETVRGFTKGEDWAVLVEKREERGRLTRRIITFRKSGEQYRRSEETHHQRLYKSGDVAAELRRSGFRVRVVRSYGEHPLPKARAAFIARKPT
ncbi:MAG: class I SAM-dependent methyltransferase [Acidobacteriota bacterium]